MVIFADVAWNDLVVDGLWEKDFMKEGDPAWRGRKRLRGIILGYLVHIEH